MPVIHLVRHGQASFGTDNYDLLSTLGHEQAAIVGRELARRGATLPIMASGSLQRQRRTAEIIAGELGIEGSAANTDDRWNEFDAHALVDTRLGSGGASGGLSSQEFQVELDEAMQVWIDDASPTWRSFSDGALEALASIAEQTPKGCEAIVATSAGVTAAIVGRLLGLNARGVIALNRVSVNASITTVLSGARGLSLLTFNDHAHFIGQSGLVTNR
jgi:broad specificity phosphatase PhoE